LIWFLAKNDVFRVEQARELLVYDAVIAVERMLEVTPQQ